MAKYLVTVGSVVDLEAGVAYGSRTEAIEALGRDVVVPILHSRKKHKRLKVITLKDRTIAMGKQIEEFAARAVLEMTWAIKSIERSARDGYTPADAGDVRCTIEGLIEDLGDYLDKIREASRYLENEEYRSTDRDEFTYERAQLRVLSDMVQRL
tara:strand:+ start:289 stop:750 length:462 start_codon:yes stop_codon:yes gene_type:complete